MPLHTHALKESHPRAPLAILKRRHLLTTVLVSLLAVGCGGSSSGDSGSSALPPINVAQNNDAGNTGIQDDAVIPSSATNPNGFLTGDIWYEGPSRTTYRFNLETGTSSRVAGTQVYPNRNGTLYVDLDPNAALINAFASPCGRPIDVSEVFVKDTRTHQVLASFLSAEPITLPVKPSPDGTRLLSLSNTNLCEQERSDPQNITMYSSSGEMLFRFQSSFIAFDWLYDGRAAAIKSLGGGSYQLWVETAAGSLIFDNLTWTFPSDFEHITIHGLKSNHNGTQFLFEAVLDQSRVIAVNFRHSDVIHLDITTGLLRSIYSSNEPDGLIKATEPSFSPDGNWIFTTQDWFTGGGVLSDGAFSLPSSGVSYVVPTTSDATPLPPVQTTDTIRAVLSRNQGTTTLRAARINPMGGQMWTPTVR